MLASLFAPDVDPSEDEGFDFDTGEYEDDGDLDTDEAEYQACPNPCCAGCGANPQHKRVPWTPACDSRIRMCADCHWAHVETRSCEACNAKYPAPKPAQPLIDPRVFRAALQESKRAAAQAQGADLSAQLLQAPDSITARTGEMERRSPLFCESAANPQLTLF